MDLKKLSEHFNEFAKIFTVIISIIIFSSDLVYGQHNQTTAYELLENVQQGIIDDNSENLEREAEFRQKRNQAEMMLADAESTKAYEENRAADLEAIFQENKSELGLLQNRISASLGNLEEFNVVMQKIASDTDNRFSNSVITAQYPDREEFIINIQKKIQDKSKLISIEDIEQLWFELTREMVESGKIVKFKTDVTMLNGIVRPTEVVRVGTFNLVSDGMYLSYSSERRRISNQSTQPRFDHKLTSKNLFKKNNKSGKVKFAIKLND